MDVVSFGETMLRLTAPGGVRLEDASTLHVYVAGAESNTLAALARLQLHAVWLSALPASPQGRHIAGELRRHGIDISHIIWTEQSARLGIFYSEEAVPPLGVQVYYDRADSACALLDPDALDYSIVDNAGILHLTGITPALSEQTRVIFKRLLERARTGHVPLSFDVNYRARLWSASTAAAQIEEACRQATVLFCTRADAAELWSIEGSPEAILRQMALRFSTPGEMKTLVLTLGSEGAAQLHDTNYTYEPALATEGKIRFGSGDAFAAGYLYAYLKGPLYQQLHTLYQVNALRFANALAALKRCISGDIAVITPDDIRIALQRQATRFR